MRFENQTAVVAACGSDAGAACALNYLQQGAKGAGARPGMREAPPDRACQPPPVLRVEVGRGEQALQIAGDGAGGPAAAGAVPLDLGQVPGGVIVQCQEGGVL